MEERDPRRRDVDRQAVEEWPSSTDRRSFLRLGAMGGAAMMASAGASGAGGQQRPVAADAAASVTVPGADFELIELGIAELRRRMESGALTAVRATELYIERIQALDSRVASVLEVNPDAMAIARE